MHIDIDENYVYEVDRVRETVLKISQIYNKTTCEVLKTIREAIKADVTIKEYLQSNQDCGCNKEKE